MRQVFGVDDVAAHLSRCREYCCVPVADPKSMSQLQCRYECVQSQIRDPELHPSRTSFCGFGRCEIQLSRADRVGVEFLQHLKRNAGRYIFDQSSRTIRFRSVLQTTAGGVKQHIDVNESDRAVRHTVPLAGNARRSPLYPGRAHRLPQTTFPVGLAARPGRLGQPIASRNAIRHDSTTCLQ